MTTTVDSTGKVWGYGRISTGSQDASLQEDALTTYGVDRIYIDTISGARAERPQLQIMLDHLRSGDTVVVWKIDRMGRSLIHLVQLVEQLQQKGVGLVSLTEGLDTRTEVGRFQLNILASVAQWERDTIRSRVQAGVDAAKARGRVGGRKPKLSTQKLKMVKTMYDSQEYTIKEIADEMVVSESTIYRALRER
ncbi:recombinase family protein [Pseudarthrobacter niigatensis]|uniref:DNA invertase Pin-like site-specific DNA recombinase n=1 Tax=Pseudarthrobacter niigatensis TaxID=369935 RepID=A0AAJ1SS82_9MICC|nr:recombinase family protein [Pseudarthrobacter niigatensis]MDQ0144964.1 DNA invertase Pin-like site-specific DNA recombinase [Pseudarthrobacter niigatensis]MDQ0264401.1 DNA invertase Pin-like site-specific DNA recombinase [Pseudarthrobacter niigatensis]